MAITTRKGRGASKRTRPASPGPQTRKRSKKVEVAPEVSCSVSTMICTTDQDGALGARSHSACSYSLIFTF